MDVVGCHMRKLLAGSDVHLPLTNSPAAITR